MRNQGKKTKRWDMATKATLARLEPGTPFSPPHDSFHEGEESVGVLCWRNGADFMLKYSEYAGLRQKMARTYSIMLSTLPQVFQLLQAAVGRQNVDDPKVVDSSGVRLWLVLFTRSLETTFILVEDELLSVACILLGQPNSAFHPKPLRIRFAHDSAQGSCLM